MIAAIDTMRGLADDHGIPWQGRIPSDSAYFRQKTSEGTIVMGFRTYQEFAQPLHDRQNFVVTRAGSPELRAGFEPVFDLGNFVHERADETVWVIGGAAVYAQALPWADDLFITQLETDFHCTKFFPDFDGDFFLASALDRRTENEISFRFEIWRRDPPTRDGAPVGP